jgi:hypothetical protein
VLFRSSGSDFTPFLQHSGVPTLSLGYGGEDDSGNCWTRPASRIGSGIAT